MVAPCDFTGTHFSSGGAWFCLVTLTVLDRWRGLHMALSGHSVGRAECQRLTQNRQYERLAFTVWFRL